MNDTPYHLILGEGRIQKICIEGGLTPADDSVVYEFLRWKTDFIGGDSRLNKAIDNELENNPRRRLIKDALKAIEKEFLAKTRPISKGRFLAGD